MTHQYFGGQIFGSHKLLKDMLPLYWNWLTDHMTHEYNFKGTHSCPHNTSSTSIYTGCINATTLRQWAFTLASFSGHSQIYQDSHCILLHLVCWTPALSSGLLAVFKMEGEGLVHFITWTPPSHLSTKVDRGEGGVPDRKNTFNTHVLHFEQGAVYFSLRKHSKLQCLG